MGSPLAELRVSLSSCPEAECGALAGGTGLGRGFRFLSFSQGGCAFPACGFTSHSLGSLSPLLASSGVSVYSGCSFIYSLTHLISALGFSFALWPGSFSRMLPPLPPAPPRFLDFLWGTLLWGTPVADPCGLFPRTRWRASTRPTPLTSTWWRQAGGCSTPRSPSAWNRMARGPSG